MATLGDDRYGARPWGERLRAWRVEVRNWTRSELRDQIEAASYKENEPRGHRIDIRLIARWERGDIRSPHPVYRRLLARIGAPLPATPLAATLRAEEDDEMNRRRFLQSAGSAISLAVGAPAAAHYGAHPGVSTVDNSYVDELHNALDGLYAEDQLTGSSTLGGHRRFSR